MVEAVFSQVLLRSNKVQPLDIDIAVMPQINASPAAIQVAGGDGLTLPPGANQLDLPALEAGQVYRQSLKVTPATDGGGRTSGRG